MDISLIRKQYPIFRKNRPSPHIIYNITSTAINKSIEIPLIIKNIQWLKNIKKKKKKKKKKIGESLDLRPIFVKMNNTINHIVNSFFGFLINSKIP